MPDSEEQLYQAHVLDHFESPYHRGHCQPATHGHEDDNPLCGDIVRVELEVDPERRIRQAYFTGEGCCISQAAASMLMRAIEGKTADEAAGFSAEEMLKLFRARLTPNRQKCCLLPWRVLQVALRSPLPEVKP
jgi:nitrogen fixation NifU-like protein